MDDQRQQGEGVRSLNHVVQIDEGRLQAHLDEVVRSTVKETLNALLDAEADRLCGTQRYERNEITGSSCLLAANNVEGCLVDGNGNLINKTDARGVQTASTYDALNRVLSKSYSDQTTPISCYQYDAAVNGVGLLQNEWTQTSPFCSTAAPSTGFLTMRSILAYDLMGR